MTNKYSEEEIDRSYLDKNLPIEQRVQSLIAQMNLEEKAGMLFHSMLPMGKTGELSKEDSVANTPTIDEFVNELKINHFNVLGSIENPQQMANWYNDLQKKAENTRLGIPVTISTDPRHAFTDNIGASFSAGSFSSWPESLGLAALQSEELVEKFADIVRQEYISVGFRVALHPQIDISTDSRWARQSQTFGEDPDLVSKLGAAYVRGLQGKELNETSVAAMVKHFPGGGPQKDGEDPHFPYGREQVYPGENTFELHLEPFKAAFAAGASQTMPYYGMPVGTKYEEVGFNFNKQVLTDLLRNQLGFEGIVCADWGVITDSEVAGDIQQARAWGVEKLSRIERVKKALNAGVDQFGGEYCTDLVIELVKNGEISEERIDESVRRLLTEKFRLGLFDEQRYVDVDKAEQIVGADKFQELGMKAQSQSVTVLTNHENTLPISRKVKLYVEGISEDVAKKYGVVVDSVEDADLAILRINAPYETRETAFENFFHAGSLDFSEKAVKHIKHIAATVPTIVDVFLDRPAILTEFSEDVAALVVTFGTNDEALLKALTGEVAPQGKLPFDLPRSMAAVEESREDTPFDTKNPLFKFGDGLKITDEPT
ncbi:MAG: glycoside hydrolase family 3 N-terminal domain-containing protein [Micrococcaceae bacterium]